MKTCSFCQKTVYRIAGHGLCAACYYREKRNGTPEYVKVRKPCSVDGCENLSVAQSLCELHYRRKKRRGVVESERFARWGHIDAHPLANIYYWRSRQPNGLAEEWKDFWRFVADVGERPPGHRLHRKDLTKPYGPDNFEWRPLRTDVSTATKQGRAEWMRAYRIQNPRRFKDAELKRRRLGIGIDEYEALLLEQGNVCAICRQMEQAINPKTGATRDLAVDHCHNTNRVRGLLCTHCNALLGYAKDDVTRLRAAIDYLERHAAQ